jgi:hypothetical protein
MINQVDIFPRKNASGSAIKCNYHLTDVTQSCLQPACSLRTTADLSSFIESVAPELFSQNPLYPQSIFKFNLVLWMEFTCTVLAPVLYTRICNLRRSN